MKNVYGSFVSSDETFVLSDSSISFNASANTITCANTTAVPSWLFMDKYFRINITGYSQPFPPAALDTPQARDPVTNHYSLFSVATVDVVGGSLVIIVNPNAATVDQVVTYGPVSGIIDARESTIVNDMQICRQGRLGATIYNAHSTATPASPESKDLNSARRLDHYHADAPQYSPFYNVDAAIVTPPVYSQFLDSTFPGDGLWNDQALHFTTNAATMVYENAAKSTGLNSGTVACSINYYNSADTLVNATLTLTLNGTSGDQSVSGSGIALFAHDLVADGIRLKGFIRTTVTFASLPGFVGGRVVSVSTTHTFGGTPYAFSYVDGVFVDVAVSALTQGTPTAVVETPSYLWLSGIQYYTTGTTLRVGNTFSNTFDQTFQQQPFFYDASALGFGSSWLAWNAASIAISPLPGGSSPTRLASATLNISLPMGSANSMGGAVSTRLRDPWTTSGLATYTKSNSLFYNLASSCTRNYDDLRRESTANSGRRLLPNTDNSVVPDRDASNWDSTQALTSGAYINGLQIMPCVPAGGDGLLLYPYLDYSGYDPIGMNYAGLTGETYDSLTNVRWYYRFFSNSSGTANHSGGVLRIDLRTGTLTSSNLDNDDILVEIMLCNTNAINRTGWISLNRSFNNSSFDPSGATRVIRGGRTMLDESNNPTTMPSIGFTFASSFFNRYTEASSNYGLLVRIGLRSGSSLNVNTLTMVGW